MVPTLCRGYETEDWILPPPTHLRELDLGGCSGADAVRLPPGGTDDIDRRHVREGGMTILPVVAAVVHSCCNANRLAQRGG